MFNRKKMPVKVQEVRKERSMSIYFHMYLVLRKEEVNKRIIKEGY